MTLKKLGWSGAMSGVTQRGAGDWHPLAAVQRSLWFLYKIHPELQGNFNIVFVARARPAIDAERLQRALNLLAQRHQMLRAEFAELDGEPMQRIVDAVAV